VPDDPPTGPSGPPSPPSETPRVANGDADAVPPERSASAQPWGTSTRPNPAIYQPPGARLGDEPATVIHDDPTEVMPVIRPPVAPMAPPAPTPLSAIPTGPADHVGLAGPGYGPAPARPAPEVGYAPYRPAPARSGNGCLTAFVVTVAVALVVVIASVVALVLGTRAIVRDNLGTARPGDYELSSSTSTCEIEASGAVAVTGTITNRAEGSRRYRISADVHDEGGGAIGRGTAVTPSLAPGQATPFTVRVATSTRTGSLSCQITDVSYLGN
jgi:hypothetical protein